MFLLSHIPLAARSRFMLVLAIDGVAKQTTQDLTFNVILIPLGLIVTIFGLWRFISTALNLYRSVTSMRWRVTTGTVTSKNVRKEGGRSIEYYYPVISYKYSVANSTYESSNWRFGQDFFTDQDDAGKVVQDYPEGKNIQVYYDPNRPSIAVLEPGVRRIGAFVFVFVLALCLIILGTIMLVFSAASFLG